MTGDDSNSVTLGTVCFESLKEGDHFLRFVEGKDPQVLRKEGKHAQSLPDGCRIISGIEPRLQVLKVSLY